MDFNLGMVAVAPLIAAIVEGIKTLFPQVDGKASQIIALVTGVIIVGLAFGLREELIPAVAAPYIEWFFVAIGGGLAAMGLFQFGRRTVISER